MSAMVEAAASASPMVAAYADAGAAAPGHLVLYRVGEFYEVLHGAAATVSRALGIQLTRRKQKDAPDIPMCGIPAPSSEKAIARLLAAGHKVALSEQPLPGSTVRPLRRLTPATSVDPEVVEAARSNNLAVAHVEGDQVGWAWLDLSTGECGTAMSSLTGAGPALARIGPAELVVSRWPDEAADLAIAIAGAGIPHVDLTATDVSPARASDLLARTFGAQRPQALRGFSPLELTAFAALLDYVEATVGYLPLDLLLPRRAVMGDTLEIDAPTLRGLEVLTSTSGRGGSLLAVLDRTVTAAGARLLARQLAAPLTGVKQIGRRLAMVRFLVENPEVRGRVQDSLASLPDMLRAAGRLSLGKASPRDLAAIRDGLERAALLAALLQPAHAVPPGLVSAARELGSAASPECLEVTRTLRRALATDLPGTTKEPGFIASRYDALLDASRAEAGAARAAIEQLQADYERRTGVRGLRIRTNSVVGYHVEVPVADAGRLGPGFMLRQGLASTTRFSAPELDALATRLDEASGRADQIEQAAFVDLARAALTVREPVARAALAAAALDLVAGLAQAAAEGVWCEPELADDTGLEIEGGRHPVAERLLEAEGRVFVENDCRMGGDGRLWLLTGPNMAGKSTFLRQVAVIVLMAQVGSFVPARQARIGVVDKMFSRIGASDDLAAGRSTFMVEMLETSAILNQATGRSFVILDEVGRGTSTHDGLSIAQACMEYLHDTVGCRTLFATHYHELADAAEAMPHAVCMRMEAEAGRHGDIFTYRVSAGRAGQSHGLKVAALAGMPAAVLEGAAVLLAGYDGQI